MALLGCEKDDPQKEVPDETRIRGPCIRYGKTTGRGSGYIFTGSRKGKYGRSRFPRDTAYKAEVGGASPIIEVETTGEHNIELILTPPIFRTIHPK